VLVTGGAGFVGGAVANRLAASGAEVTVLDDLSSGRPETVPERTTLVQGSVRDAATVRDLVARHPLVFHLAARGIIASTRDPREDFETNVAGTLNLLLAARECGVERIVYASSRSASSAASITASRSTRAMASPQRSCATPISMAPVSARTTPTQGSSRSSYRAC
jgi:nucleoside-diphosphate-sugar epimerase